MTEVLWVLIVLSALGIVYIFVSYRAFLASQRREAVQAALKRKEDIGLSGILLQELVLYVAKNIAEKRGEKFDAEAVRRHWKEREERRHES